MKKRILTLLLSLSVIIISVGCATQVPDTPSMREPETDTPSQGSGILAQETASFEEGIEWGGLYDVIVVGFGGAGAVTAITAADAGASVLVLEKAPLGHEGGNTRYALQCILAVSDKERAIEHLKYLRGDFITPDDLMIETYVDKLLENRSWLKSMGANSVVDWPRPPAEYPEYPQADSMEAVIVDGEYFTSKFWKLIRGNVMDRDIDVWFNTPGEELIQDPDTGAIIGITVKADGKQINIRAKNGVVLCTGGFENNQEMIQDYLGLPEGYPMGGIYNTGDGIKMAMAVGADLWHMQNMMGPYLNFKSPDMENTFSVQIQGSGIGLRNTIFVGADGTRFLDEATYLRHGYINFHGRFVHSVLSLPAYAIFDEETRLAGPIYGSWSKDNSTEIEKGWITKADNIKELAKAIGYDPEVLANTVSIYNGYCKSGYDPAFNRSAETLNALGSGPYYAMELKPSFINTQGGPRRNEKAEVLDKNGNPIPHLYSAGEMGSLFSNIYQGAGNLAECIAFGRIAGENAAAEKAEQPSKDLTVNVYIPQSISDDIQLGANEFLGKGVGIGGDVVVKVTMIGDKIKNVEVISQTETPGISDPALEKLPAAIVAANSPEVDTITGATVTSKAIIAAVKDALAKVG